MIVRTAVLKGKDPLQILAEMEKIDQMGKVNLVVFLNKINTIINYDLSA